MSTPYLQSILDSALDALVTIDSSGNVVEFNAVAERLIRRKAVRYNPIA